MLDENRFHNTVLLHLDTWILIDLPEIQLHFLAGFENEKQIGLSAQEVQKVLPEAVIERELNGENILLVKYEKIVPLLVEAIKELNEKVERLQSLLDK